MEQGLDDSSVKEQSKKIMVLNMDGSKVQDRVEKEEFKDWMVVECRQRKQQRQRDLALGLIQGNIRTGSQFNALSIIEEDEEQRNEQSEGLFHFGNCNQLMDSGADFLDTNKDDSLAVGDKESMVWRNQVMSQGVNFGNKNRKSKPNFVGPVGLKLGVRRDGLRAGSSSAAVRINLGPVRKQKRRHLGPEF